MPKEKNDAPAQDPVRKGPSQWAREKAPEAWKLAGAQSAGRWEDDFPLLSEAEFDAALQAVGDIRIG